MWQKFLEGLMGALAFVSVLFVTPEMPKEVTTIPFESQEASTETNLQEMQTTLKAQQSKINEQEEKIKEFEKSKNTVKKENAQVDSVSQKSLACSEANRIQSEIKDNCGMMPYPGVDKCIDSLKERYDDSAKNLKKVKGLSYDEVKKLIREGEDVSGDEETTREQMKKISKRLEKVESLKPLYLKNSEVCGVEAR